MTIKIKQTTEVEKQIELPYYYKFDYRTAGVNYYAILNEEKVVTIASDSIYTIHTTCISNHFTNEHFRESSASEFVKAFDTAVEALGQLVKTNLK